MTPSVERRSAPSLLRRLGESRRKAGNETAKSLPVCKVESSGILTSDVGVTLTSDVVIPDEVPLDSDSNVENR